MKYQVYIFDFDYTLGDTTAGIVQCVNFALRQLELGEKTVEEIRRTIGLSLKNTYQVLTADEDERNAERFSGYFKQKADEVMTADAELYQGVREGLEALKEKGCKIGIVTTKFHYRIEQILAKFGAEKLVDVIVGGEDVKEPKPSPEGLLLAAERLEAEKEQILYVGDSLVDAETAQRAKIAFAGVLTGTTTEAEFAEFPRVCVAKSAAELWKAQNNDRNGRRSGNENVICFGFGWHAFTE